MALGDSFTGSDQCSSIHSRLSRCLDNVPDLLVLCLQLMSSKFWKQASPPIKAQDYSQAAECLKAAGSGWDTADNGELVASNLRYTPSCFQALSRNDETPPLEIFLSPPTQDIPTISGEMLTSAQPYLIRGRDSPILSLSKMHKPWP